MLVLAEFTEITELSVKYQSKPVFWSMGVSKPPHPTPAPPRGKRDCLCFIHACL